MAHHGRDGGGARAPHSGEDGPPDSVLDTAPKIFVGGIRYDFDEEDVRAMFKKFGTITDISMPRDPTLRSKHKGYGFVTFDNWGSMQDAMDKMDGAVWEGARLSVRRARHTRPRNPASSYARDPRVGLCSSGGGGAAPGGGCSPEYHSGSAAERRHRGGGERQRPHSGDQQQRRYDDRSGGGGGWGGAAPDAERDRHAPDEPHQRICYEGGGRAHDAYSRDERAAGSRPPAGGRQPRFIGYRCSISGLAEDVDWRLLKDFLRQIGDVTYSHTVEGSGRGIGEYRTLPEVRDAITKLTGAALNGCVVKLAPLNFDMATGEMFALSQAEYHAAAGGGGGGHHGGSHAHGHLSTQHPHTGAAGRPRSAGGGYGYGCERGGDRDGGYSSGASGAADDAAHHHHQQRYREERPLPCSRDHSRDCDACCPRSSGGGRAAADRERGAERSVPNPRPRRFVPVEEVAGGDARRAPRDSSRGGERDCYAPHAHAQAPHRGRSGSGSRDGSGSAGERYHPYSRAGGAASAAGAAGAQQYAPRPAAVAAVGGGGGDDHLTNERYYPAGGGGARDRERSPARTSSNGGGERRAGDGGGRGSSPRQQQQQQQQQAAAAAAAAPDASGQQDQAQRCAGGWDYQQQRGAAGSGGKGAAAGGAACGGGGCAGGGGAATHGAAAAAAAPPALPAACNAAVVA